MDIQIITSPRSVKANISEPKELRSVLPEPEELRSVVDTLEPQGEVNVTAHPKNRLYIDSGASVHILFNRELLGCLIQLDRVIKIQAGGKKIIYHKLDHFTRYFVIYHFL